MAGWFAVAEVDASAIERGRVLMRGYTDEAQRDEHLDQLRAQGPPGLAWLGL